MDRYVLDLEDKSHAPPPYHDKTVTIIAVGTIISAKAASVLSSLFYEVKTSNRIALLVGLFIHSSAIKDTREEKQSYLHQSTRLLVHPA